MHPQAPLAAMHTDAADVGYGGTLGFRTEPGDPGLWESQGIWGWQDRAESISYRELKAIRLLLTGPLGDHLPDRGPSSLLIHCDNLPVVHVTNALVSASRPMMRELRRLKNVLDNRGLHIRTEWIPSVANKFADALSRRFPSGDLQVLRRLRRSIADGMQVPLDAFPLRPLGEHPAFLRRQTIQELAADWETDRMRLLCPPLDLVGTTVRKIRRTGAPAVLLVPNWPRQPWYQEAVSLAHRIRHCPLPPEEVWQAARKMNPSWRLMLLEFNLPQ